MLAGNASNTGAFSMYLDGSDLGLTDDGEDVDGLAVLGHHLYLATLGSLSVPGVSAANEDVVRCPKSNLPADDPTEKCDPPGIKFDEYFDGGDHGIAGNVSAIEVPLPPGTE